MPAKTLRECYTRARPVPSRERRAHTVCVFVCACVYLYLCMILSHKSDAHTMYVCHHFLYLAILFLFHAIYFFPTGVTQERR